MREYIEITPHRSIMTKIAQTGYSVQESISELIDNSIDARLDDEKVIVEIVFNKDTISVKDNGKGMDRSQAQHCIRLGYSSKKNKLGEFGLGLKTSTSFLGEEFILKTKQQGSKEEYQLRYNENEWLANGDWFKFPMDITQTDENLHGTLVEITKLKIEVNDKLIARIEEELGKRFAPFIMNNEAEIIFNGKKCEIPKTDILEDTKREFQLSENGVSVKGWWAYQLSGYNKSLYGFNTFRRGRLVTVYDKIGISPNEDIKQIVGELEITGVPITHDKKNWVKSSEEFVLVEKLLKEYFSPFEYRPKRLLTGYPASKGKVVGIVRQINMFHSSNMEQEIAKVNKGDIIVTAMTRPQYLIAIRRAGGIITDLGGTLCHAAIVSREFGIPAVVGTNIATSTLIDGTKVILDGGEGTIYEY